MSARRKGVRQGAALFLAGAVLVPVLGVISSFTHGPNLLDILVPLAAIIFFLGGLMRMLFAALFEEGAPKHHIVTTAYAPPHGLPGSHVPTALPPAREIRQPSSVTENTTRLLDKDDPANR